MKNEGWHIELLQIFCEVSLREGLDAIVMRLNAAHHSLEPPVFANAFRDLGAWPVVSVERKRNVLVELSSIVRNLGLQVVEDRDRQAAGILVRLHHQGCHCAYQHGHGYTFHAMPADITGNFSAAGGVAYMDCVLQVELFRQSREIVGISYSSRYHPTSVWTA